MPTYFPDKPLKPNCLRIAFYISHGYRYCRDPAHEPLLWAKLPSGKKEPSSSASNNPSKKKTSSDCEGSPLAFTCQHCGSRTLCEMQILPSMINVLKTPVSFEYTWSVSQESVAFDKGQCFRSIKLS